MAKWFIQKSGQVSGPLTTAQLRQKAAAGELTPADKVRRDDVATWTRAGTVKGLFDVVAAPPPPAAPSADNPFDFFGMGPPPTVQEGPGDTHAAFEPAGTFDFFGDQPTAREARPPEAVEVVAPAAAKPAVAPPAEDDEIPAALPIEEETVPVGATEATGDHTGPVTEKLQELEPEFRLQASISVNAPPPPVRPAAEPVKAAPVRKSRAEVAVPPAPVAKPAAVRPAEKAADWCQGEAAEWLAGAGRLTGGVTRLTLGPGWLVAMTQRPGGEVSELYLPIRRIDAAGLSDVPLADGPRKFLTFHAGGATIAVAFRGPGVAAAREFLQKVLTRVAK